MRVIRSRIIHRISGQLLNASAAFEAARQRQRRGASTSSKGACSVPYNWVCARTRAISVLSASRAPRARVRSSHPHKLRANIATMKCIIKCAVLVTLISLIVVNGAEIKVKDELQALAEQIQILKTLHLSDVKLLKKEVAELK